MQYSAIAKIEYKPDLTPANSPSASRYGDIEETTTEIEEASSYLSLVSQLGKFIEENPRGEFYIESAHPVGFGKLSYKATQKLEQDVLTYLDTKNRKFYQAYHYDRRVAYAN